MLLDRIANPALPYRASAQTTGSSKLQYAGKLRLPAQP